MTCGRCKEPVQDAEHCWWCVGPLCASCWDDHGECGHPEAAAYQRIAAYWRSRGQLMPIKPVPA